VRRVGQVRQVDTLELLEGADVGGEQVRRQAEARNAWIIAVKPALEGCRPPG
jgi:hypothetical protein